MKQIPSTTFEENKENERGERERGERREKLKMKRKIHSNVPNQLITDFSYIFALFFFFKKKKKTRNSNMFAPFFLF